MSDFMKKKIKYLYLYIYIYIYIYIILYELYDNEYHKSI